MIHIFKRSSGALLISGALSIFALLISALLWSKVPELMPIHWDAHGQPDRFASRAFGLTLMPALTFALPVLMLSLPLIGPRRKTVERSTRVLGTISVATSAFFFALHIIMLGAALNPPHQLDSSWLLILVGALLLIIGNAMPKFGRNFFIGVRTPWALADDKNWIQTQRFGGKLLVFNGFFAMALAFLSQEQLNWALGLFVASTLLSVALSFLYSWLLWRRASSADAS